MGIPPVRPGGFSSLRRLGPSLIGLELRCDVLPVWREPPWIPYSDIVGSLAGSGRRVVDFTPGLAQIRAAGLVRRPLICRLSRVFAAAHRHDLYPGVERPHPPAPFHRRDPVGARPPALVLARDDGFHGVGAGSLFSGVFFCIGIPPPGAHLARPGENQFTLARAVKEDFLILGTLPVYF